MAWSRLWLKAAQYNLLKILLANNKNSYIIGSVLIVYGMWCSLVARLTGGQEVASSSLVIPIDKSGLKPCK